MLPDPLESFLLSCLKLTLPEKTTLEKVTKFDPLLSDKISKYAPNVKQFQKAYSRPFPGLNVLTSLYLVNIQHNSKLHHPQPKLSRPAPGKSDIVQLLEI